MRSLVELSVRRPVLTSVVVVIAVFLGIRSYLTLGVQLLPNIEIPVVGVYTSYPGAGPEEVERQLTQVIEKACTGVEGLREIQSFSTEGFSFVILRFNYGVDVSRATVDVSTKVKQIAPQLPEGASEPSVEKFDINDRPFLNVGIVGKDAEAIRRICEDRVVQILQQVEGVAGVDVSGPPGREVVVRAKTLSMLEGRISYSELASYLGFSLSNLPLGRVEAGIKEQTVRLKGGVDSLEDLKEVSLGHPNIKVKDLAEVSLEPREEKGFARLNGRDVVILSVRARPNTNIVSISKRVNSLKGRILSLMPPGTSWQVLYDASDFVDQSIRNVIRDMLVGIALTGLIIFLFLKSFGATFAVAVAMPTSIAATFIPFSSWGITLNVMSTLGLATSVGVLVNNSILVLENIYRFEEEMGLDPISASVEGTSEIAVAVLATTATNLAVFVPIAYMGGIVGMFFNEFALAVVCSTLFSLWVAFTVTPALASRTSTAARRDPLTRLLTGWWDLLYEGFEELHERAVGLSVRFPKATAAIFIALAALCAMELPRLGVQFQPRSDEGVLYASISMPAGSSTEATLRVVDKVEKALLSNPWVERVSSSLGRRGNATVTATLKEDRRRPDVFSLLPSIRRELSRIEGARFSISTSGRGGGRANISISVVGPDLAELDRIAAEISEILRSTEGVTDVDADWEVGRPDLVLTPRQEMMRFYGVQESQARRELEALLKGIKVDQISLGDRDYDVRVKSDLPKEVFLSPEELSATPISIPSLRRAIPLGELFSVSVRPGPTSINRIDGERAITVTANSFRRSTGEVFREIEPRIRALDLPFGYRIKYGGEIEQIQRELRFMLEALVLAVTLTFLLVAALLESYRLAVLIMFSVPLSLIGIVPLMIVTETPISVYGVLGGIVTVGLVVNNAIVVLEYAERLRKSGKSAPEAVVEACRVRLKPIVMADATTLIALVPLALGFGAGGSFRAPMGVVMLGGILAGGTLSVLFMPSAYVLLERLRRALSD